MCHIIYMHVKTLFIEASVNINKQYKQYLNSVNSSPKSGTVVGNTIFKCPISYPNILFDVATMRRHI